MFFYSPFLRAFTKYINFPLSKEVGQYTRWLFFLRRSKANILCVLGVKFMHMLRWPLQIADQKTSKIRQKRKLKTDARVSSRTGSPE